MSSNLLARRLGTFKRHKKGYWSLVLLSTCFLFSLFGELLCNDRPLLLSFRGKLYLPFLFEYSASTFGEDYETEIHYPNSDWIRKIEEEGWILWAPIRFSSSTIDGGLNEPVPSPPNSHHILGTDDRGRDIFARLLFGFRTSLIFSLVLASLTALLGFCLGALQAYEGGIMDLIGQRLTELWSSIPELFLLLILSSLFQPSLFLLFVFMGLLGWVKFAELIRAEVLKIRQLDFVKCADLLGASKSYVIIHHIFPNALNPLLSYFPIRVATIVTGLASLDFLGLGSEEGKASLGELFVQGKNYLSSWWILVSSILALGLIVISLNFIADGIRNALDPKT